MQKYRPKRFFRMARTIIFILLVLISAGPASGKAAIYFDDIYRRYHDTDSKTLASLGRELISRQSNDTAMAVFTILANRFDVDVDDANKRYAIEARLSLGVLNFLNANYAAAYSNFLTATQLEGRTDSPGNLNLSAIYLYYGDRQRAYRSLRQVFYAAVKSGNRYMASAALINLLTSDIDESIMPSDTLRSIIGTFRQRVPRSPDDKAWPLAHCYSEAAAFSLDRRHREAIDMLRASLDSAHRLLIPKREYFASFTALGKEYLSAGRPDSSEYFFRSAEKIARDNSFVELLIDVYSELSALYASTGRPDLASEYKYKHLELHDSVFNAREFGRIHDLELFYEADKFEKRINRIKMEEQMRSRIFAITGVGLVILAVMLVVLFLQNRTLRLKNRSLFERNMEIMSTEKIDFPDDAEQEKKYNSSALSEETRSRIAADIRRVMADEAVFCRKGFSMRELAEHCNSNQRYVSQVLNEDFGKTFTQLLNERRINVARRRLMDFDHYGNLTIEAIVSDLGFKSRSTFSKTFKRLTGLTPSEFQRMAASEKPLPSGETA